MPHSQNPSTRGESASPDYIGLVNFLLKPLLDENDSFSIDCELVKQQQKVWVRIAFESTDKGKIFGRGGRNIQAIRTILNTAALNVGQSVYLDVFDSSPRTPKKTGSKSRNSHNKPRIKQKRTSN
ncbi:MAG: KH domain-containing protein [Cyanobacteria bacterium J083]|nr:MAG: KH domain-containing protein [Cyanobacteria bacterium J083]